jgi:hypothetical protein
MLDHRGGFRRTGFEPIIRVTRTGLGSKSFIASVPEEQGREGGLPSEVAPVGWTVGPRELVMQRV